MTLTTKKCAEILGVTDKTIRNYIKNGKLSAKRLEDGNYTIDEAEFYRVYPNRKPAEINGNLTENNTEIEIVRLKEKNTSLENEIRLLNKQIDLLAHQLEQYQARENKLLAMADSTTKLLTHEKTNKKRKWFGR